MPPLSISENLADVSVTGESFRILFDKGLGKIVSFIIIQPDSRSERVHGKELIESGPVLNAWRAATDNDGFKVNPTLPGKLLGEWIAAGLHQLEQKIVSVNITQPEPQIVRMDVLACERLSRQFA